jgi:hypothetical protein
MANYRYPLGKLNETSDFLQINIVDYKQPGKSTTERGIKEITETVNGRTITRPTVVSQIHSSILM